MSRPKIGEESQIERRLRLRDLRIFSAVAEHRSMAKAAAALGVAQPSISEVISDLEHNYRVKLFDRSPRGVQLTAYGEALLKRSIVVFDEIRQSARDIEFLADPTVGQIRIACVEFSIRDDTPRDPAAVHEEASPGRIACRQFDSSCNGHDGSAQSEI